jgi:uncharacterized protein (DUF1501 family)
MMRRPATSVKAACRLNAHQLNEARDLALTTDFRSVLGGVLARHQGVKDLRTVFPGFDNDARKFPGLLRT